MLQVTGFWGCHGLPVTNDMFCNLVPMIKLLLCGIEKGTTKWEQLFSGVTLNPFSLTNIWDRLDHSYQSWLSRSRLG
jgi:hypothetical protein